MLVMELGMTEDYEEGHNVPQSVIDQAIDDVECDRFVAAHMVFPDNGAGS